MSRAFVPRKKPIKKKLRNKWAQYAFCGSQSASSRFVWHIRKLTKTGLCVGKHNASASLCKELPRLAGLDISVPVTQKRLDIAAAICPACLAVCLKRGKKNG